MVYDCICRVFVKNDRMVGIMVALYVVLAAYAACHVFSGRAAFLLTGAMIATIMSANVLVWIIPGQRKVVAALQAGQPVDPIHGKRAKQRSVHNTYFTLPVLFAMLSGHYSFTYTHPQNWLVLVAIMLGGALIRQFFVMRHHWKLGRASHPLPYALVGVAILVGVIVLLKPQPAAPVEAAAAAPAVSFAQVQPLVQQHCLACHGAQVQMKNVRLDSSELIAKNAQAIYQQVTVAKIMPMGNATGMTEADRALIGRWFQEGAKTN